MKTRTIFTTAVIILLFCFSSLASGPEKVLGDFYGSYSKKKFRKAARLLNITSQGVMDARITEMALKNMWYTFHDRATRVRNTEEVVQMNREEVLGLKEEIELMKEEGVTVEAIEEVSSQLSRINSDLRLLEALIDTEAEITGPVIAKEVVDEFAVVATRATVKFPGKFYKEISAFVSDVRLFMPTVADKYIALKKNSLTFPVVFYLIDTSSGWKLMLFSQDRFPAERFEDFLVDFDISFGQLQWMAGAQAQIFWEEASLEMFSKKIK